MLATFVSAVKWVVLFILHIILTVILGFFTWAYWGLYQEGKSAHQFQQEGQPVTVTVTGFSTVKKNWTDYLGNIKYISFTYKGKSYDTRYKQDTVFVMEGTKLPLLYDPALNAFMQPVKEVYDPQGNVSPLIGWTAAGLFSTQHKALMGCLIITIAFFFLLSGLLARIPGLYFLTSINGFVFSVLLLIGVVYVTYDAFKYYQYYHHIKDTGVNQQVNIEDKGIYYLYHVTGSGGSSDPFRYVYTATVSFKNSERTIPISVHDYDQVPKGSRLNVYYDPILNDMMAADYSINPSIFIFTALIWLLLIVTISKRRKRKANNAAV